MHALVAVGLVLAVWVVIALVINLIDPDWGIRWVPRSAPKWRCGACGGWQRSRPTFEHRDFAPDGIHVFVCRFCDHRWP